MYCTVRRGSPGPKEAVAGFWGPWAGVVADAAVSGRRGAEVAEGAETLAARWRAFERRVEYIEFSGEKNRQREGLVEVFCRYEVQKRPITCKTLDNGPSVLLSLNELVLCT